MYRKFAPEYLFHQQQLHRHQMLVTREDGTIESILPLDTADPDVLSLPGVLLPGMINAHCHLELSHLKGAIPTGTGLSAFVQQVMTQRSADEATKTAAMQQALQQMEAEGIVAVGDICNTTDSIPVKLQSRMQWHHFIEVSGFVDAGAEARLAAASAVKAAFDQHSGIGKSSITPHAPYSVSATLFKRINQLPDSGIVSVHNQETPAEDALYRNKTGDFLELYQRFGISIEGFTASGSSSLQTWLPYFTNGQQLLLVHNSFIGEQDIQAIQKATGAAEVGPAYYCCCINANRYIEQVHPPVPLFLQMGCTMVIGTDSLASNHQLSLVKEMYQLQQAFPALDLATLLTWATQNGAMALRMPQLGRFEPGTRPGLVWLQHVEHLQLTAASFATRVL